MTRARRLLAGVSVAVATAAAALLTVLPAHAESNGGVRIMPLGDSITDGLTVPGGYRIDLWQKLVAAGYAIDFVGSLSNGPSTLGDHDHEGHSGWTIAQIDANIVNWLRTTTPRTILLHIGTNDMIGDAAGAPARLSTLLDHITATSPDAEVFVATIITLPAADSAVRTFNAAIPGIVQAKAAAGRHVHLVDMYSALTSSDLADGVHPNAGGYSKMATIWYNALRAVPGSLTGGTPPSSPPATPSSTPSSTPSTRPSNTPSTTPTTPPVGACTATYRVVNSWNTGFQGEITVRAGTSAISSWTVSMTLASGQSITNIWNGVSTGTSGAIAVRNAPYNGALPASGTTTFGFVANGDGSATPSAVGCTSP